MELTFPSSRDNQSTLLMVVTSAVAALLMILGSAWPYLDLRALRGVPPDILLSFLKLMTAASVGFLLTMVQRRTDRAVSLPLEHAQILLCVAGALLVMVIGDSLARAVGIIGGASLIRFRTPIEDPKDATLLFIFMALGMATGLGHFALAGTAALVLVLLLPRFRSSADQRLRSLTLQVVGSGPDLPSDRIESVLRRRAASFEPREISRGERPTVRYHVSLDTALSLDAVSRELLDDPAAGIYSLSWDTPKKERYL